MRIMVALAGLLLLGIAHGQDFAEARNKWAYEMAAEFKRCGLWPTPLFAHRERVETRYEFAIMVYENLRGMPGVLAERVEAVKAGKTLEVPTPIDRTFDDLDAIIVRLDRYFESLEVDQSMLRQLARDARENAARLRYLAAATTLKKNFPDIPENHWAYDTAQDMAKHELVTPLGRELVDWFLWGPRPWTRVEFALILDSSIRAFDHSIAAKLESLQPVPLPDDLIAKIRRLSKHFAAELAALGVQPGELEARLDRAERNAATLRLLATGQSPKFADVPAGHWAAKAVKGLHSKGLLTGYPRGNFGG